jgi:hypothetical protein
MNEKQARWTISVMMQICVVCALVATFLEQDLLFSLISISGYFTFRFARDNPKLLLATSWQEFGDCVDQTDGKSQLLGSRWYFICVIASALYVIIV